jgi:hypothetical protein
MAQRLTFLTEAFFVVVIKFLKADIDFKMGHNNVLYQQKLQ